MDKYLPIIGPIIGISEIKALQVRKQFDKFVADTEALEHDQVAVTDGLLAMVDDMLEILRILGVDITEPSEKSGLSEPKEYLHLGFLSVLQTPDNFHLFELY